MKENSPESLPFVFLSTYKRMRNRIVDEFVCQTLMVEISVLQTYHLSEGIDDDGGPSGQLMKYIFVNVVMVQPITIEYKYHIEQMWVRPTLYTN